MKFICMAPKLGALDVPVNTGPTVGVNTSDRNSTNTDDTLEGVSSSESESDSKSNGKNPSANSGRSNSGGAPGYSESSNGNGAGSSNNDSASSQLKTDVGSLHLQAPSMLRRDGSESSSQDEASVDHVDQMEQQDRLNR